MSGGFFLVCRAPTEDRGGEVGRLEKAFAELGFATPEIVESDEYILAVYPNLQSRSAGLRHYPNGDFAFTCGTCLFEGAGLADAALMSEAAAPFPPMREGLMGHYALVVKQNGRTEIRLDSFGGYHLFYSPEERIVSSSFYAICSVLDALTISQQSACEYVFNGVVSGNETLFREVKLAPIQAQIVVRANTLEIVCSNLTITRTFSCARRDSSIRESIALLDRYFSAVRLSFGDRVRCALSGGYDSRLILAFLRRHGVTPGLYVYGRSQEGDVRIAAQIAQGEGFPLEVVDKDDRPIVPPNEFSQTAHRNFLATDGYGYAGIFHNGAETEELRRRVLGSTIAVNGGGGEIFRNFFYLLNREYTVTEILWSFYSQFDPATCTALFDSGAYYHGLERKVMNLLRTDERRLPRPTVEWLYHSFRCRAWDGKVDTIAGWYGFTAMPYLERPITEHASALPPRSKRHGAYEAELIRRIDNRLAQYPSIYGHDFSEAPPISRRISDYWTYLRPPWLRRFTYRLRSFYPPGQSPAYLALPYQEAVIPGGIDLLRCLFQLERVWDPAQRARIMSLEYALRYFGSRVRIDF